MPPLIPLAFGFTLGVCMAPSVRKHPRLQSTFAAVDDLQETFQDAWRGSTQALRLMVRKHGRRPLRLFNPH